MSNMIPNKLDDPLNVINGAYCIVWCVCSLVRFIRFRPPKCDIIACIMSAQISTLIWITLKVHRHISDDFAVIITDYSLVTDHS